MNLIRKQINAATKKQYSSKHEKILLAAGYTKDEWATWKAWKSLGRKTVYGQKPVTLEYSVRGKEWTVDLYNIEQTEELPVAKVDTSEKEALQQKIFELSLLLEQQRIEYGRKLEEANEYSRGLEKALNYYADMMSEKIAA